ncbi:MAG: aspartate 1-decarboxylase [Candidatus Saganbacteria bacterium]|nr:aspartate 1-decarboxylase [Candidatus Saganbacteria bacterium]
MLITMLKGKIHMATITDAELYYEGSIAIDKELLKKSGIIPGEKVTVLNFDNGHRFETYTIDGKPGQIGLRGPAARLGKPGEKVIIIAYAHMTPQEAKKHKPKILKMGPDNKIQNPKSEILK